MPKPTTVPHWADTPATLRTTPPAGLQNTGFSVLTKLPAQYFNWLLGLICDWWVWVTSLIDFTDGIAVTGHVTATEHITATTEVFAGTYMKPTTLADVLLDANATPELAVHTLAGAKVPVSCGIGSANYHAMTPDWAYRASVTVAALAVGDASEAALNFTTEEYDTAGGMWDVANPNRLVAPATGYYHIDLYGEFEGGAVTLYRQYISLHHSADSRVLTRASTVNDSTGSYTLKSNNALSCSIDCYLVNNQYVYARCYQKNGVGNLNLFARATMHRFA